MDLADWYAAGRWVALLELIDMLPAASRLNEAIVNDPETARDLAMLPSPKESWAPRVSEFDLTALMMRDVLGVLTSIQQTLVAVNGGKPSPRKPFPAPRTEIDRAREALEREFMEDIGGLFGFDAMDLV